MGEKVSLLKQGLKKSNSIKWKYQTILKSFLNIGLNAKKMNVPFLNRGKKKDKRIKNWLESYSILETNQRKTKMTNKVLLLYF